MVVSNLLCTVGKFGFGNVRFVKNLYNRRRLGTIFDEISTFKYLFLNGFFPPNVHTVPSNSKLLFKVF